MNYSNNYSLDYLHLLVDEHVGVVRALLLPVRPVPVDGERILAAAALALEEGRAMHPVHHNNIARRRGWAGTANADLMRGNRIGSQISFCTFVSPHSQ